MIKAIFFDIDGTLVSFNTHVISDRVMSDLNALRRKGVKLFIASGRHYRLMDNLGNFPFDGYVCMNGALSILGGEPVYCHPLDRDIVTEVAERCDRNGLPAVVFAEDSYCISLENDLTSRVFEMIHLKDVPVVPLKEIDPDTVCQFTIFADQDQERELVMPGIKGVMTSRWFPAFFDMNPEGITKAEGISQVISRLGISRDEVMAFGDGGNDIEMLEFAGIGVAMGNATEPLKACADYVTLTVDNDGISHALRHFGIIGPGC